MRVNDLTRQKLITLRLDVGDGDTLNLTFDRNRITPHWFAQSKAGMEDVDPLTTPRALAEVITEWDVTTDGVQPFPPTAENLAVLSMETLKLILLAILEAATPSDAEGKASSVPSSIPPSDSVPLSQTHPNGEATSPSPVPSAFPSPT